MIDYDSDTNTATLLFDGSLFSLNENIDAVHLLASGNIVLSTQGGATLGGFTFDDGDLVEYNAGTDSATLYFDESAFSGAEDIIATSILSSGNILLTTTTSATIGGLSFSPGDLAEYNPGTDMATLFFDRSLFSAVEEIDAVSVLTSGNIVLSTDNDATLGGLTFNEGDLIEYNFGTDTSTLFFDSALFSTSAENIDAVFVVPEPSNALLLGLGLAALVVRRRR